jgi:hypothetical protein
MIEKRKMNTKDLGDFWVCQSSMRSTPNFKSGGVMKNVMKNKSIVFLGSVAGTCLVATVAFANPSLVPDHPGYPMNEAKSPVSGVSTANDPGQENFYGQKALNAATKEGNEDMNFRSRAGQREFNESESQNKKGDQSQLDGQKSQMPGQANVARQDQTGSQNQKMGQEHMTREDQTTGQHQNEGQNQIGSQNQIKSQSQSQMDTGNPTEK